MMAQETVRPNNKPNNGEDVQLEWEYKLPFLHSSLLKKILIAFGTPIIVTGVILALWIGMLNGLIIMMIVAGLFSIGVLVAAIVFADGFHFTFRLTAEGIWSHLSKREGSIANATMAGGLLAGSPGATGAGLLAKAEQSVFISWSDIKKVKVVEKNCSIKIGRPLGYKPIELYCSHKAYSK